MKLLMKWGPARGYFPEPAKSIVVVDDTQRERCQVLLREFDFRYTDGHRYVGGYIGSDKARSDWIDPQIQQWVKGIKALAKVARRYPQTAYAGLQKSLQSEWMYLQRVTDRVSDDFAPIERAIQEDFLPALFDATKEEIAEMRPLLALSVRRAGLGIPVPTLSGPPSYRTSTQCTAMLTQSLLTGGPFSVADYQADNKAERIAAQRERAGREELVLKGIVESAPPNQKRRILRSTETGSWLTAMPNALNGTELSAVAFRDSLRLRYGLQPTNLPLWCDGCTKHRFDVDHAMSCKKGGMVFLRHNEVAAEFGQMCVKATTLGSVSYEPVIKSSRDFPNADGTARTGPVPNMNRGDIAVRGFWHRGTSTIFDVRITDTDAASNRSLAPGRVLAKHEKEKKKKYLDDCLSARNEFTPLVFSVDGMAGGEAQAAMKRLASLLAGKWGRTYSAICGYVRSRMSVAVVRGMSLCLRGCRDPTRREAEPEMGDGAGLRLYGQ